jgi:hypothetical protein
VGLFRSQTAGAEVRLYSSRSFVIEQPAFVGENAMTAELGSQGGVAQAALLLRQAIEILDAAGAPSDIAAHLDLALVRLDALIETPDAVATAAIQSQSASQPEAG